MNIGITWMACKTFSASLTQLRDPQKCELCSCFTAEELAKQKGLQGCPPCIHTVKQWNSPHIFTIHHVSKHCFFTCNSCQLEQVIYFTTNERHTRQLLIHKVLLYLRSRVFPNTYIMPLYISSLLMSYSWSCRKIFASNPTVSSCYQSRECINWRHKQVCLPVQGLKLSSFNDRWSDSCLLPKYKKTSKQANRNLLETIHYYLGEYLLFLSPSKIRTISPLIQVYNNHLHIGQF